jgi:hypothetical protein
MEIIEKPWPHIIIDNYYNQALFDDMRREFERFHGQLINSELIADRKRLIIRNLDHEPRFPCAQACINARPLSEDLLSLFAEKREYISLSSDVELSIIIDGLDYKKHCEAYKKVLSAVTYVSPNDDGVGTLLYETENSPPIEVEWKPNRTLIFPGIDNKTWHSYKCNDGQYRITINSFLNRPNDKRKKTEPSLY